MQLTIPHDKQDLEQLEQVVNDNLQSFYDAGRALAEIRDRELYKIKNGGEYRTFAAYCKGVWDMSRPRAYQLIDTAHVQENLSTMVDKPIPERQARPLIKLNPEQRREAWKKAVETAPDGKVTAKHISEIVMSLSGEPSCKKQIQVPTSAIAESAVSLALSAILQLEKISDEDPTVDEAFSKVEEWIENRRQKIKMVKVDAVVPSGQTAGMYGANLN